MIYLHENGVTIVADKKAKVGQSYELNGKEYLVVNRKMLENLVNSGKDVTKVVTTRVDMMLFLFAGKTNFNQDISSWDVSNVRSMTSMFERAKKFNQNIGKWNVNNAGQMESMFEGANSFNRDISNWNICHHANLRKMFANAFSFNQPIGHWKLGPYCDISYMFLNAKSFNQDLNYWNVKNISSMISLFEGAESFNQDLDLWDLPDYNDLSLNRMFKNAKKFNSNISTWKFNGITRMDEMFSGATSFNQDISLWDVSKVEKMDKLFYGAESFNQNLSDWSIHDKLKIKTPSAIFKGAKKFSPEHSPFQKKKRSINTSTKNLTSEDKKTFSKIKKLLIERDYDKINLGIELLRSLDKKEVYETLLYDCKINTNDYDDFEVFSSKFSLFYSTITLPAYGLELIRNKLFTGSEPAQPFLDYALINLIANAPSDAKLDESINVNNISSFDLKLFKLQELNTPLPIEKFTSLKTLTFNFDIFNINSDRYDSDDGGNGVNIEDLFGENNITHLQADNIKGSLKWMKKFKQLKSLEFRPTQLSVYKIEDLESFKYLENLEELKIYSNRFDNLDFLINCKNIKKLNLTVSSPGYSDNYPEMEFNGKLQNINFLKNLHNLKYLRLSGLSEYEFENFDFSGLYSCKQIKELYMDISDSTDLSKLKKCISLESLKLVGGSNDNVDVSANILDINGFKQLKSLKSISTETLSFYGLDNGNLMTDSNSAIIVEKSTKVNVKDVALIHDIRRYKGLPFNGTIYKEINEDLFFEYDVVDGFKDGVYREFYLPNGNIKLEILYEKNKINKIIGFYDEKGINKLDKEICISAFDLDSNEVHRIGGEEGGFFFNDKRYTGYCLLDISVCYSGETRDKKLRELIENLNTSNVDSNSDDKVSLLLKLKNGIITKDILVATKEKYIKTSVVNEYDFDNMPSYFDEDTKEAFKKMDKENHHRLHIYMNNLYDIPVLIEGQNPSQKQIGNDVLEGKSIVISGVFENYSRNELKELIELKGGKSSSSITKNTSFVLAGDKMGSSKKQKANDLNIKMIGEEEFAEKYVSNQNDNQTSSSAELDQILLREVLITFSNKPNSYIASLYKPKSSKLTSDNRKSFSEIKKLLSTRDFDKIDEGVQKLVSLNKLELFETLLKKCEITVRQTRWGFSKDLLKNKIFTGSGPTQPYLNYALFSVIANTPNEAKINDTIMKRNFIDLDMSVFDLSNLVDRFIPIEKFTSLSTLKLDFEIFKEFNKGAKNINRENWFANNKINELEVNVSGSLQWMKNFTQLKFLKIEFGYYPVNNIESFEFLENLEELSLKNFNYKQVFKNLGFLKNSKKIRKFALDICTSGSSTDKLKNIDIIKNFTELTDLEVTGIHSGLNLDFLLSCKKIKNLTLKIYNSKDDTNYFELLKNCSSLETLYIEGLDSYNIKGKVLNINGLNGLPNLKNFSLNNVNISTLDNSIFIN